uniref:Uncharacterized protein n=1 Tax=uncultured marine group II/III euryarchaeote AD1000_88_G11 TaxID=1457822 RepID=A0A075G5E0_9EURY|nr:hypothetical protein [uncultured marine group II/III euryarchaeote AD1000_88_G11]
MVYVVLIEKLGNVKESKINKFNIDQLFKKCKHSNNNNFSKRNTWKKDESTHISVFAKNSGRANSENKYDLPPPMDAELFFGTILLCAHKDLEITNDNVIDLTKKDWLTTYSTLMGGFDDLDGAESVRSEDEDIDPSLLTEEGYLMNSFIVDKDEEDPPENSVSEDEFSGNEDDETDSSGYNSDDSQLEGEAYE